jgi:phage terminase Nu1 subunit (DNA packaging protein)
MTRSVREGGAELIALPGRAGSMEPWVNKRQLASHLGRSTRWVELMVREGMPSQMIGGRRGFRLSAVERWIEERAT